MNAVNQIKLPYLEVISCDDSHGAKGRTTKLNIMEAAVTLFMQKGFNNTPVREICAMAKVAKGTFYLYFEAKEQVIDSIYEYLYHYMAHTFSQMQVPEFSMNGLMAALDRLVALMKANRSLLQFVHHPQIMGMGTGALWEIEANHMLPVLITWVERAKTQGIIRQSITPEVVEIILQMIHDALENALLDSDPTALDRKVPLIKDLLQRMILS